MATAWLAGSVPPAVTDVGDGGWTKKGTSKLLTGRGGGDRGLRKTRTRAPSAPRATTTTAAWTAARHARRTTRPQRDRERRSCAGRWPATASQMSSGSASGGASIAVPREDEKINTRAAYCSLRLVSAPSRLPPGWAFSSSRRGRFGSREGVADGGQAGQRSPRLTHAVRPGCCSQAGARALPAGHVHVAAALVSDLVGARRGSPAVRHTRTMAAAATSTARGDRTSGGRQGDVGDNGQPERTQRTVAGSRSEQLLRTSEPASSRHAYPF